jgi:YidC/Oxa1 family membrane protein insertase
MDQIRILLWAALLTLLWLGFSQWLEDYGTPPPAPPSTSADSQPVESLPGPAQTQATARDSALPPLPDTPAQPGDIALVDPVRVITDVLDIVIDSVGGDIVRADLLEYPVSKDDPDNLVRLLDYEPATRWVFQTGVRDVASENGPTHLARFTSRQQRYELSPERDELIVTLDWSDGAGLSAHKTYTFRRGSYAVGLDVQILNETAAPWNGMPYLRMAREHMPRERTFMDVESYSDRGPMLYNGDSSEKPEVEDLAEEPITDQEWTNGWFASIQHHFLAAGIPPREQQFSYSATASGNRFLLTARGANLPVAAGSSGNFPAELFIGPKLHDQLEQAADGLVLAVDYGVFTPIAGPMFWLLDHAHSFLGNWGLAIISVTLLIKLVFYKLTESSGKTMAKMRKLAPRLKSLQERYKDDKQALSQAMMELYRKEKVNPAAGCLPMVIQMPFFLSFYWVLIESVEMRQAPFFGWINDLSARDPYFVLPLLMAAAMYFQTRLNPTPPDPVQARVMQLMPLVFSVMFAFFPAGLVIYWLTNTLLGIAQQWRINKVVAADSVTA